MLFAIKAVTVDNAASNSLVHFRVTAYISQWKHHSTTLTLPQPHICKNLERAKQLS